MAWADRSSTTADGNSESADIPKPTNTNGDLIVVAIRLAADRVVTAPAGFTEIATGINQARVYWKIASGEGVGNYSFTWTGLGAAQWAGGAYAGFENAGGISIFEESTAYNDGAVTDHDLPSVTPDYANSLIVGVAEATGGGSALTWTSTDLTEKVDHQRTTNATVFIGVVVQALPGASGTKRVVSSIAAGSRGATLSFYAATKQPQLYYYRHHLLRVA